MIMCLRDPVVGRQRKDPPSTGQEEIPALDAATHGAGQDGRQSKQRKKVSIEQSGAVRHEALQQKKRDICRSEEAEKCHWRSYPSQSFEKMRYFSRRPEPGGDCGSCYRKRQEQRHGAERFPERPR